MKLFHVFTVFATVEMFFEGQFKYLTEQGYEIVVVASDSPNAEAFCKRNGVRFVPVEIPRSVSPVIIAKAIRQLCSLIRKEKPDAVFGHTPVGALCAMLAANVCRVKNRVYYRHGVIYTTMQGLKRSIFKTEEKFVARLATSVISVSQSLSKLAIDDGLNHAAKQQVIGHGTCGGIDAQNIFNPQLIDEAKLRKLKSNLGLGDADIVFGFCGRLCKDKGTPELVEAFEMFRRRHPDLKAKLLFIGKMDERDILPQSVKDAIAGSKDIFLSGWISKFDIPYYYAMLDAFVFPSHREGFVISVLEASAMEKPVVVSRAHGCVDAIVEHETGEYIELSPAGICEGMELMLDADLRKRLGENGRKSVLRWYDVKVMWPLVAELYKNLLK